MQIALDATDLRKIEGELECQNLISEPHKLRSDGVFLVLVDNAILTGRGRGTVAR